MEAALTDQEIGRLRFWLSDWERQQRNAIAPEPLSNREIEVLRLIARGEPHAAIASKLFLTVHTVKSHSSSVLAKMGCNNMHQAVAKALRTGILDVADLTGAE